jgi:hypothetical protein
MKIESIESIGSDTYVVFSSSRHMSDYAHLRNVTFCLEDDSLRGLKIPNTAIANKTAIVIPTEFLYDFRGERGVYLGGEGGNAFRAVSILAFENNNALATQDFDGIKLGAVIYSRDDRGSYTLSEIAGTSGVYVANSGTAEFRRIIPVAGNEHYTIVSMSQLKPHDRIVSNASEVLNNMILK